MLTMLQQVITSNQIRTMESIEGKIIEIVTDKAGIQRKEFSLDVSFRNDLGLDSLDVVELTIDMENTFKIDFTDAETQEFQAINQVVLPQI